MKKLAILRHAKSSWDDPGLDDFNRPLNERGWKAARRMGRDFNQRGLKFDLVLSSTSARTRETIDGIQQHYDFKAPIRFEDELYHASETTLMDIIRSLDDGLRSPLIVGHNPGLEMLIADLTRHRHKFPTGALAMIELPVSHWAKVEHGSGRLAELIRPKELD